MMDKKELIEEIQDLTANQGMPCGLGMPMTEKWITKIIDLVTAHNMERVIEAVTDCDYVFTGGGYMGGQVTCVELDIVTKAIKSELGSK